MSNPIAIVRWQPLMRSDYFERAILGDLLCLIAHMLYYFRFRLKWPIALSVIVVSVEVFECELHG
jgi:hypothetical protein